MSNSQNATSPLGQFSEALAALVEQNGASVVRVEGRRGPGASGVVWSAGVVVTAEHVVEVDEGIEVYGADGRALEAEVAGRDPGADVAVLRVKGEAAALVPPRWSAGDGLAVGHVVVAIGRPGRTARAALGILSARGEKWRTPAGGRLERYLETDVAQRPGFSGGVVVDHAGGAVGIHTTGLMRRTSLVVPQATLERVVRAALSGERVERAWLGIGTYAVRLPRALAASAAQESALLVVSLQPDGPAEKAGFVLGDALVALDGKPLLSVRDLLDALDDARVGHEANVKVARAGALQEVRVKIGARPR